MDSNSSRGDNEGLQNDIALESENDPLYFFFAQYYLQWEYLSG